MKRVSLNGGRRLAYAEYGAPEGTPVVFLHGTPGSRRLGELLESAAEAADVRLLAPDRPGYGDSSPWPERSVRDAEAFLTPLFDEVEAERVGLVAFSGGAPYALAAAATCPERVDRTDLVAGATPPELSEATPALQRVLGRLATTTPTVLGGLLGGQAWLAARLDPSFVLAQYTDDAEAVPESAAETVRADFLDAFAESRQGAVTEFRHAATDWDIDLADVTADVRLWHGGADTNVPVADARRLEERLPNASLRVFEDADHLETLLRSIPDVLEGHR
jgi:pimeloyl-ACP methyl ester carboxylesterase